ncbi:hypothetical protein QP027_00400 [Corynebacterium breve]|uniref:Serine protease n=1 Tax=Corynebacterium breve TaxID=3049799 RepID=A0ABY8VGX4_9CORY|nr:hypothetical protein [Corynebacterium breve]WIM67898.1 hypothetical protein QP027_00400 [Corynebacterium breve]
MRTTVRLASAISALVSTLLIGSAALPSAVGHSPAHDIDLSKFNAQGVLHDDTARHVLTHPDKVLPGAQIVSEKGVYCSAGWIVDKHGERFVSTAAHCGEEGTRFGIVDRDGYWHEFGQVDQRFYGSGFDRSLIRVTDRERVQSRIPITNLAFGDAASSDYVARAQPTLCVLGQKSGLSCGPYTSTDEFGRVNFSAVAGHGDSGGPVFALDNGTLHPVGLLQGGYADQPVLASQPLNGPLFDDAVIVH